MLQKSYYKTSNPKVEIKVTISYDNSGHSWATSRNIPKGYYVNVTPVEREYRDRIVIESFTAFSGFKDVLLQCDRQSAKRLETAKTVLSERLKDYIELIQDKVGLDFVVIE